MENKRCKKREQWYKKIRMGNEKKFYIRQAQLIKTIPTRKIETYSNDVYVSNTAKIKPRELHRIVSKSREALKKYGISDKKMPVIVILSEKELPQAYGKYDAVGDIVYYIPEIADRLVMGSDFGLVEYHEMWHVKQANEFREKGLKITEENYIQYMIELCETCKKKIDALGISEYNVGEISDYALDKFSEGRFDEVEAEYMIKQRKGG